MYLEVRTWHNTSKVFCDIETQQMKSVLGPKQSTANVKHGF